MRSKQIQNYLEKNNIPYEEIVHEDTMSAYSTAMAIHVHPHMMGKVVAMECHGKPALLVLPADERILMSLLKESLQTNDIRMMSENEVRHNFTGSETGAMSGIGEIYHVPTFISNHFNKSDRIYFNADTHNEVISLTYEDFMKVSHPQEMEFSLTEMDYENYRQDYYLW